MKARYDLTNGIIVTGETLEELRINWENRIYEHKWNRRLANDIQGMDDQYRGRTSIQEEEIGDTGINKE